MMTEERFLGLREEMTGFRRRKIAEEKVVVDLHVICNPSRGRSHRMSKHLLCTDPPAERALRQHNPPPTIALNPGLHTEFCSVQSVA